MKLTNSPLCNFCNEEEDTFLHAFSECEHVNDFWNNVKDWVNQNTNNDIHLSKTDIILGKFGSHQNALNIILLICKMYIFRSARESNRLSLHEIKLKIQYYYQVEKKAFFSKGKYRKFTKRWQDYLHLVEAINWYLSSYTILWIIICSFMYKSVYECDVLVCICWKYGTLYNNLTIWYYAFTQNIAYCYTYKKSSIIFLYSSEWNLLHLYYIAYHS